MSNARPSPDSNGDTTDKRTGAEPISDVRNLDVDDAIVVGDRSRPITVDRLGVRSPPLADGDSQQHFIHASGEWDNAKRVELHNEIHISGRLTGQIVEADSGRATDVRRVER